MIGMVVNIVLAFFFGWLVLITFIVLKLRNHYRRLTKRTGIHSIDGILDSLLREAEKAENKAEHLEKKLNELQIASSHMYRKIGIVYFHALGKTEGEKSLVIALLNNLHSGVVINFMYIPDGVRVYTKKIKEGKGETLELTQEELEAIAKAV
ncbi:hypothetical protein COZ40_02540 [Candidatus Roizmanbacteria bacterium CG_4_10_14_3_um_filter_39_13]|uniref:DUF4446 domain-containing protein n=3 Tax=Candidatus Roizmaniibacteriota TaxID=1752723 RepID=A0A2M7EL50_9BACT|nr:MAG: hypothetical protein COW57_00300 [Candidatus Roizmanbacteria bacterium CG17_big_fil_post_rev_8_21_14_2_50_39_7]PIX68577.1 MAG: hypothetical protein COZ40_02540 [Candidatus Roizmanbacteria bacterium CG_4_10_14_3_um_filter_39_13]